MDPSQRSSWPAELHPLLSPTTPRILLWSLLPPVAGSPALCLPAPGPQPLLPASGPGSARPSCSLWSCVLSPCAASPACCAPGAPAALGPGSSPEPTASPPATALGLKPAPLSWTGPSASPHPPDTGGALPSPVPSQRPPSVLAQTHLPILASSSAPAQPCACSTSGQAKPSGSRPPARHVPRRPSSPAELCRPWVSSPVGVDTPLPGLPSPCPGAAL